MESGCKKNAEVEVGATYRHYKGNQYKVLALAKHSETLEDMVVYVALYGNGQVWVRPKSMWNEEVEKDGRKMLRFTKVESEN